MTTESVPGSWGPCLCGRPGTERCRDVPGGPMRPIAPRCSQYTYVHDAMALRAGEAPKPWTKWQCAPPGEPVRQPRTDKGFVYFIRGAETRRIKIGRGINPEARMYDLQIGNSELLELIAAFPTRTMCADEAMWHRRFAHLHIRGEWHTPATDLLEAIEGATGGTLCV